MSGYWKGEDSIVADEGCIYRYYDFGCNSCGFLCVKNNETAFIGHSDYLSWDYYPANGFWI
jgi:hypothetical protein